MPGYRRSKRRYGRRVVSASRPYVSGRSKAATVGRVLRSSKRRQRPSLASKAKSSRRLRSAVVANAKALDAVKKREFGYWQTTNSVLDGADPDEHMGNSYNNLTTDRPVLIHLNNLHSCNGAIPVDPNTSSPTVPVPPDEQQGACHLLTARGYGTGVVTPETAKDGLVREFSQPCTFAVNGVMQKMKRTGPHMYPRVGYPGQDPLTDPNDTPLIPIPNGKKVKWGGVDLQFRIEGALQNTQFDFYIVKCNKEQPLAWDPWHQTIPDDARSVPGVLPYTINDFQYLHHRMYPKKVDTKRYSVLSHRRVLVNNVHRVTGQTGHIHIMPDNAKYATGNTWSHTTDGTGPHSYQPTHPATTPAVQHLRMSYKPNKILRPLRNFIGERLDTPTEQRGSFADANPNEKATLGTMSWDNFHPSANVWLVMTTNHHRITTDRVAGPYSHKGATMTDLTDGSNGTTNQQWNWQGTKVKQEPPHYTQWRTTQADGRVGSDIRETQLERLIAMYGAHGTSGHGASGQHADYVTGGQFYEEWQALILERLKRDDYRNPRIHIFRRTWWQDEHIPTELSEAQAKTEEEAKINIPNPTVPSTPVPKTAAALAELQRQFDRAQMNLKRSRSDPRMAAHDTTSDNPVDWQSLATAAGLTLPTDIATLIANFQTVSGLMELHGQDRYKFQKLQRLQIMVQPPTPNAPLNPWRNRLRVWQQALTPSNDPMLQDPPVG